MIAPRLQPKELTEWCFKFGLVNQDSDDPISVDGATELMELIIEWAEKKGYGIGGGFGPFDTSGSKFLTEL